MKDSLSEAGHSLRVDLTLKQHRSLGEVDQPSRTSLALGVCRKIGGEASFYFGYFIVARIQYNE